MEEEIGVDEAELNQKKLELLHEWEAFKKRMKVILSSLLSHLIFTFILWQLYLLIVPSDFDTGYWSFVAAITFLRLSCKYITRGTASIR